MTKIFKIKAEDIVELIQNKGACYSSDKITIEGMKVGYMYREEPDNLTDSGWRFFSGTEDQEYADDPNNTMIYDVNTIANYDKAIIPYLDFPYGTEFERIEESNKFRILIE